jgi:hypothetical protein
MKRPQKPKLRKFFDLFKKDSPFKQRIEKDRTKYIRKLKHKNTEDGTQ